MVLSAIVRRNGFDPELFLFLRIYGTYCRNSYENVFLSEEHQEAFFKKQEIFYQVLIFANIDMSAFLWFIIIFFSLSRLNYILIWFQYIRRVLEMTLALKHLVTSGKLC